VDMRYLGGYSRVGKKGKTEENARKKKEEEKERRAGIYQVKHIMLKQERNLRKF
jgi:hypothetical protein